MSATESAPDQARVIRITRYSELTITILMLNREPRPGSQQPHFDTPQVAPIFDIIGIGEGIVRLVEALGELPEAVIGLDLEGSIATLKVSSWASSGEVSKEAITQFGTSLGVHVELAEADAPPANAPTQAPGWSDSIG